MRVTMARRTAGRLGCGGGPLILFSPPRCLKATVLQESEGEHADVIRRQLMGAFAGDQHRAPVGIGKRNAERGSTANPAAVRAGAALRCGGCARSVVARAIRRPREPLLVPVPRADRRGAAWKRVRCRY